MKSSRMIGLFKSIFSTDGRHDGMSTATIISYRRFNQLGVDVVDAFETFQPRSLLGFPLTHRMCTLTIG